MTTQLEGKCNKCGHCCEVFVDGRMFRCTNLAVHGFTGYPGASHCMKYGARYEGMPIALKNAQTGLFMLARCAKNSQVEVDTIIKQGISRGCCSLREV